MNRHNPQWQPFTLQQALERLPSAARRKYRSLAALITDAEALTRSSFAREKLLEDRLLVLRQRTTVDQRDPQAVEDHRIEVAELAAELEQLSRERGQRHSIMANCQQTLSQLDTQIPKLVESELRTLEVTSTSRSEGEDLAGAIIRIRTAIAQAKGELQTVKIATLPAAEIKQKLRDHVQAKITQGTPRVDVAAGQVKVSWPDVNIFGGAEFALAAPPGAASAMLAWLFPDQVYGRLVEGVDRLRGGLSVAARQSIQAELTDQILDLEREEETLVEAALAAGLEVHRRPNADPYALLGVEPITPNVWSEDAEAVTAGTRSEDADAEAVE